MAYRRNGEVQLERVKANGNGHTNAAASVASGLEQEPAPAAKGEEPAGRKLRLHRKLLFSVGGLPYQLCGNSIGFYLSVFLLEVVKLSPFYVMLISFLGRAWDAITDPIVGLLVDRFHFGRFGKFRPWILCSLPFGCVSFFFLWFSPPEYPRSPRDEGLMLLKLAHYSVIYLFFQTCLTCHQVPFTSMTMSVASSQRDRDTITALRMFFEISGMLFGAALFGLSTAGYRMDSCNNAMNETNGSTPASAFDEDYLDAARYSYMLPAGISVLFYVACTLCVVLGTREHSAATKTLEQPADNPFFGGLREVLSFKPYLLLMGAFMGIGLGLQIVQGNIALFVVHTYKHSGLVSTICLMVTIVVAIAAVPVWNWVIFQIGKKWTFAIGIFIILPALAVAFFLRAGVTAWVLFLVFATCGLGLSIAFLLPWSMLPDVIDDYYLQKGVRREAVFYSFYVFFNKFATGISFGVSQLVIGVAGYDVAACEQPAAVGEALRYLVTMPSAACFLLCLVSLYFYPINETKREANRKKLERLPSLDLSDKISPEPEPKFAPVPVVHTSRSYGHTGGVSALESPLEGISPPPYKDSPTATPLASNGHLTSLYNKLPISSPSSRAQTETRF